MPDLILRGGTVIDGSGSPAISADVVIRAGRIASLEQPGTTAGESAVEFDVSGLTVAPGFIDMHAHSDLAVLADNAHSAKLLQGVTLEVVGQDGLGYAPVTDDVMSVMRTQLAGWNSSPSLDYEWRSVADYLALVDHGAPLNVATLVPHGTVRMMVMGTQSRAASEAELSEIRRIVDEGLCDGAMGLSTGLSYAPGMYASDDEIVDALRPVRERGGYYCPHHRNYGSRVVESYRECLAIAERAGVPLHLAHCHVNFPLNAGRAGEVLDALDAAIASGLDVSLDAYPYTASATYLASVLPSWAQSGGAAGVVAALNDPRERARIVHELEVVGSDGQHGVPIDWQTTVVSAVANRANEWAVGLSIAELAQQRGMLPGDAFCDLLIADELGTGCLMHVGNEENVRAIMRHPAHTLGTDGILVGERPHPRGWGSFPRFLGHYSRVLGVLNLEEAVAHVTSRPARRLGLRDRGLLAQGFAADLVVFDPRTIDSPATYEEPKAAPVGVHHVLIAGEFAVRDGERTDVLAGRAVRRAG